MSQLLPLSRAARLLGIARAVLQRHIQAGTLHAYDGMIATEELLQVFPDIRLEDSGFFEQAQHIKQEAFARRVRDHVLPAKEVLAERLFEQSREMADVKLHLQRYHSMVIDIENRIRLLGERSPAKTRILLQDLGIWVESQLQEVLAEKQQLDTLTVMDDMLRIMSAHVTMQPSRHDFFVEGNDTLLEAALKAGLALNYGCNSGNCGLCKARVISGLVSKARPHDYVLTEAEKQQGHTLMCCYTAVNDVTLEALEASSTSDIPVQELAARVKAVQPLSDNVMLLHLQTPRSNRLRFLAGQSVTLGTPTAGTAELSIASCPCNDRDLQFHIQRGEGGNFGQQVFQAMKAGETVTVYGPWGEFTLHEDSPRHAALFIAFDHGFGPIKSLIEHVIARENADEMQLIWVATGENGHYLGNLCRAWTDALENFHYLPYQMSPGEDVATTMQAIITELQGQSRELARFDVYLGGTESYLTSAMSALNAAGMKSEQVAVFAV